MPALGVAVAVIGGLTAAFSGAASGDWVAIGIGSGIAGVAPLSRDQGEDGGRPS